MRTVYVVVHSRQTFCPGNRKGFPADIGFFLKEFNSTRKIGNIYAREMMEKTTVKMLIFAFFLFITAVPP